MYKIAAALEGKGLKFTKSGKILTRSGQNLSFDEAEGLGLFDNLDLPWETILEGFRKLGKQDEDIDAISLGILESKEGKYKLLVLISIMYRGKVK